MFDKSTYQEHLTASEALEVALGEVTWRWGSFPRKREGRAGGRGQKRGGIWLSHRLGWRGRQKYTPHLDITGMDYETPPRKFK